MSSHFCKQTNAKVYSDGKIVSTCFPPKYDNSISSEEAIREAVYRCMRYTSKLIGKCELSNKLYNEDKIYSYRIPGSYALNNHNLSGNILYHPDNEFLKKDAEMLFECEYKIIMKHSLQNSKINIFRSNGKIEKATITSDCPLHITDNNDLCVHVEFMNNGDLSNKWIPLSRRFSKSIQKEVPGLLELNPNLNNNCVIIDIVNNHPEWLNIEREKWNRDFKQLLDKSKLKYKFNYI